MFKPLLLQAFEGTNTTVPVWFMRQAGRYLPQYRALKEKHPLQEMFCTPELAAQITCLPVGILDVDAAILFADILTLPAQMGFDIRFDDRDGPVLDKDVVSPSRFGNIHDFDDLSYIAQTIRLVKQRLPKEIPLIGFAGSPFTVVTYLIEGGSSTAYSKTLRFIQERGEDFHRLMKVLTKNTVSYLKLQKQAGIDVFQIFDTWAGILRPADYARWVLPYVQEIFASVELPSIYYVKNAHHLLSLMDKTKADFLSVCHTVVLGHHTLIGKTKKGIQGNLFNGLLYADTAALEKEVKDVLVGAQKHDRFIFNLSHGVFPDTDVEKLKFVVKKVHEFKWNV